MQLIGAQHQAGAAQLCVAAHAHLELAAAGQLVAGDDGGARAFGHGFGQGRGGAQAQAAEGWLGRVGRQLRLGPARHTQQHAGQGGGRQGGQAGLRSEGLGQGSHVRGKS